MNVISFIFSLHYYACIVKMSLFSYNPANQLSDDVLLVIFNHLDEEDLLRCETVCRQWRKVLLSGEPWEKLFDRKIVSSPQWRQVWPNFVPDENELQTGHCRSLCRAIIRELKQIDRNWRTGNYKKTSRKVDSLHNAHVVIGCDYIALEDYRGHKSKLKFHHRSNLKLKSFIVIPQRWSATTNAEIAVLWDKKNIKILDSDGQLMAEVPELDQDERISWKLASCCIEGDQLAVLSRTKGQEKLSLWDVKNPTNVICLKSRWFNLNLKLKNYFSIGMDDKFIIGLTSKGNLENMYFFSKETLDLHWQKTVEKGIERIVSYEKGMLFLYLWPSVSKENASSDSHLGQGIIKVYDVKSGQCFRELPAMITGDSMRSNSKFLVVSSFIKYNNNDDINNDDINNDDFNNDDINNDDDYSSNDGDYYNNERSFKLTGLLNKKKKKVSN